MARAAGGDRDAFAAIYRSYDMLVLRFVRQRVGNRDLAEDIAARTWMQALANVHRWVEKGRDPGAWLVTIARNLVADYFKSGRHRYEVSTAATRDVEWSGGGPEDEAVALELAAAVKRAFGHLVADQQECLALWWRGLSIADTARVMGRHTDAVKQLRHRARARLRTLLARELDTAGSPP